MSTNELDLEVNILNLMLNEQKQSYILENLDKRYFEDPINSVIFECAKELYYNGNIVDLVILRETLNNNDATIRLVDVTEVYPLSVNTEKYCKMLADKYFEKLIRGAKTKKDLKQIELLKESLKFEESKIKQIGENIENFEENYLKRAESALKTGFISLDSKIGSFMGGDYIALGGSTGTGKTSLALNLARQFCLQEKTVLYFSLEMPLQQIQNRLVCMNKGINALIKAKIQFKIINLLFLTFSANILYQQLIPRLPLLILKW